ncbi:hypothetical protein [Streptomyces sp. NPDC049906]|uniref:hypothetical protein n=1 Tax=Streptomyces sp. NPDC049906 TaxID=3155656 RepID=UPI00342175E2
MSGDSYYFGDNVNMHGGAGNTGIVHRHAGPARASSPALEEAVQELLVLLRELRTNVPPLSARSIDESVPVLTGGPEVQPEERHRALMAITGVAATAGALGQPVVELVQQIIGLLGG